MVSHLVGLEPESVTRCLWTHNTLTQVVLLVIGILDKNFAMRAARIRWLLGITPSSDCESLERPTRSDQNLFY